MHRQHEGTPPLIMYTATNLRQPPIANISKTRRIHCNLSQTANISTGSNIENKESVGDNQGSRWLNIVVEAEWRFGTGVRGDED